MFRARHRFFDLFNQIQMLQPERESLFDNSKEGETLK